MFESREEAGKLLAQNLVGFNKEGETVVLGLARGGMVVAQAVAKALGAPLDVLVVKKIGAPGNEELGIGAVGPDKTVVWDEELCARLGIEEKVKSEKLKVKSKEREEKEKLLRQDRQPLDLTGKTVILVDDGIATGATAKAAAEWIKTQNPNRIILAVPVMPEDMVEKLELYFDKIVCLKSSEYFISVGQFYREFGQVGDEKVVEILNKQI